MVLDLLRCVASDGGWGGRGQTGGQKIKLRFSLLSFTSLSFKSLLSNYSLLKGHKHALSRCHISTLFSHNRHDHSRIRILVNIFSIRSSGLKKNILLFIITVILILKGKVKIKK